MAYSMAKTSFTVHLSDKEGKKLALMKEKNPTFSRNALIRLAIESYNLQDFDPNSDEVTISSYEYNDLKLKLNALHKQLNPDWKRKKSLPFHYDHEYNCDPNYYSSNS